MIVVSDTGPLNYLVLIGEIGALPRMYGRVTIPGAVGRELTHPSAPAAVRQWIMRPPDWLDFGDVAPDAGPPDLHSGEREAISLAQNLSADLILLDETKGRAAAISQGLRILGMIGVLAQAAAHDLLALPDAVEKLRRTSFQMSDALLQSALALDRQRQS